jgi:short-subunit dehydrogenase
MSASLRRELQVFGVDVIIVGPGSLATPIWDKAEANQAEPLRDTVWAEPFKTFKVKIYVVANSEAMVFTARSASARSGTAVSSL